MKDEAMSFRRPSERIEPGRNVAVRGAESQVSYDERVRYRDFMGWDMPWYSAQPSRPPHQCR